MYRELIEKNFKEYRDDLTHCKAKREFAQTRVVDEILRAGGKFFNEERTNVDGGKMDFKELNPVDKEDSTLILTKIMQAFRDMGRKGDRPDCCSRVFSQNCNNNRVREKSMKKKATGTSTKKKGKVEQNYGLSFFESTKNDVGKDIFLKYCNNDASNSTDTASISFAGDDFLSQPLLGENGTARVGKDSISDGKRAARVDKDDIPHNDTDGKRAARVDKDDIPHNDTDQESPEEESSTCGSIGGSLLGHNVSGVCPDSTSYQGRAEWGFDDVVIPRVGTGSADRQHEEDFLPTDCVLVSPPASIVRPMNIVAAEQSHQFRYTVERLNSRINRLEGLVCFLMKANETLRRNGEEREEADCHSSVIVAL
jgi:hypothetical protein